MTDEPDKNPVPPEEGCEITEVNGDDHLTAVERTWPVVPLRQREQYEAAELAEVPTLELTVFLAGATQPEARAVRELVTAVGESANALDAQEGGAGYTVGDHWAEAGKVVITLLPVSPDGAAARMQALVGRLKERLTAATHAVTRVVGGAA
jgi:hypothetical protein